MSVAVVVSNTTVAEAPPVLIRSRTPDDVEPGSEYGRPDMSNSRASAALASTSRLEPASAYPMSATSISETIVLAYTFT